MLKQLKMKMKIRWLCLLMVSFVSQEPIFIFRFIFLPIWLSVLWPGEIIVIYKVGLHKFGASCFLCVYQKLGYLHWFSSFLHADSSFHYLLRLVVIPVTVQFTLSYSKSENSGLSLCHCEHQFVQSSGGLFFSRFMHYH